MKKVLFVLIILILLALTACQEVGEARFLPTKFTPKTGGTLKAVKCSDSDGGINYNVKGTITVIYDNGYKRVETDYCNPDGTLREWYCGKKGAPGGLLRAENYVKCAHGCKDGACLSAPKTSCYDTDGGKNYYEKGIVTFTSSNGSKRIETDYCNRDDTLNEWYCEKGLLKSENYIQCEYGCFLGACRQFVPFELIEIGAEVNARKQRISLEFVNQEDLVYKFQINHPNYKTVFTEYTPIEKGDQFILSTCTLKYPKCFTHVLRFDGINTINKELTFTDLATGQRQVIYDLKSMTANLIVAGINYKVLVTSTSPAILQIDLNGNEVDFGPNMGDLVFFGINIGRHQQGLIRLGDQDKYTGDWLGQIEFYLLKLI